jgi:dephospho-CoA kinase
MIRDLKTDEVVIDGVRNIEEVETFRRLLGHDFVLVAIHASPSTRMARILTRRRADDATDETTFRQRDGRELSWGIGAVIALADLMIVNEGAVSDVKAAVRHILSEGRRAA